MQCNFQNCCFLQVEAYYRLMDTDMVVARSNRGEAEADGRFNCYWAQGPQAKSLKTMTCLPTGDPKDPKRVVTVHAGVANDMYILVFCFSYSYAQWLRRIHLRMLPSVVMLPSKPGRCMCPRPNALPGSGRSQWRRPCVKG